MSIDLPADLSSQIESLVAGGEFADETAVIRAALDHLHHYRGEVAAIKEGLADEQAGRVIPVEQAAAEIRSRFGFSTPS